MYKSIKKYRLRISIKRNQNQTETLDHPHRTQTETTICLFIMSTNTRSDIKMSNRKRNKETKAMIEGREREDLRKETIAVLVEEAEGLLELGDLLVGELIRHFFQESVARKSAKETKKREEMKNADPSETLMWQSRSAVKLYIMAERLPNSKGQGESDSLSSARNPFPPIQWIPIWPFCHLL